MEILLTINFLKSFFNLFMAKVEEYKVIDKNIFGTIVWLNEGDKQDFVFNENFDTSLLSTMKLVCDFIVENKLVDGDKIIVSEFELLQKLKSLKWNEIEAKNAINSLCNLEVKMLDEGVETDSFFIHF